MCVLKHTPVMLQHYRRGENTEVMVSIIHSEDDLSEQSKTSTTAVTVLSHSANVSQQNKYFKQKQE